MLLCNCRLTCDNNVTVYYVYFSICVVSRGEATHRDFVNMQCTVFASKPPITLQPCRRGFLYVCLYMYMNYLGRDIFLLLVALLGYLPGN